MFIDTLWMAGRVHFFFTVIESLAKLFLKLLKHSRSVGATNELIHAHRVFKKIFPLKSK